MKLGFNLEELDKNNAHSIQAIRGPRLASSILFQSSGMTNGIVEERDIPEELPKQKERKKEEEGEDYENTDSDQESVDEEADEEGSDMSPVKEAWEVLLPEESQADEQSARCFILDRMNEDDAYDFSTDYV
nr:G protein nucleolar 3 [Rousettus aegyptiacus]